MPQQNKLKIRNKTNEFIFKSMLKINPFLIISYTNNVEVNSRSITKNQICTSLSNIVNKKSEKFPLKLITFNNFETLAKHLNSNKQKIISVIKIKNLFVKNILQIKKLNFAMTNLITLKIFLIKKLQLLQITQENIKN